jgi:hypothetical protein
MAQVISFGLALLHTELNANFWPLHLDLRRHDINGGPHMLQAALANY